MRYFIIDEVEQTSCNRCGQKVTVEFSIPNPIWNKIVRKGGPEHDREYLCIWCFVELVIEWFERSE